MDKDIILVSEERKKIQIFSQKYMLKVESFQKRKIIATIIIKVATKFIFVRILNIHRSISVYLSACQTSQWIRKF